VKRSARFLTRLTQAGKIEAVGGDGWRIIGAEADQLLSRKAETVSRAWTVVIRTLDGEKS
jgi:hypothetical protein